MVAGKELGRNSAEAVSRVSELEVAYLAAATALAPEAIAASGFIEPSAAVVHIVKAPASVALSHEED